MLSSRATSDDEDEDEDGESTRPGEYEPWSESVSRVTPRTPMTSQQTSVPPSSRPSSRPSQAINQMTQPKLWPPRVSPVRSQRRRPRRRRTTTTPEIIIESQYRQRHHRSSEGNRIITIPLDSHPTIGMCGQRRQVLEIERVRCRRRRKHRPCCHGIVYDAPPTVSMQPHSNFIYANPLPASYALAAQHPVMPSNNYITPPWISTFSHLTPEIIGNLPRQTVHLPPIHLQGSQGYPNTELETVIFPAEIVNPVDGTLSIIQCDPTINAAETSFIQSPPISPLTIPQSPMTTFAEASGPFMQRVHDLVQQITVSQSPPLSPSYYQTTMQVPSPVSPATTAANIRPMMAQTSEPYNTTTFAPAYSRNAPIYPPANMTPYRSTRNAQYNFHNNTTYQSASIAPYSPAYITPYTSLNPTSTSRYQMITGNRTRPYSMDPRSYGATGTTSAPSTPDIGPYSPANITPITSWTPPNTSAYQLINSNDIQPSSMDPRSYRNSGTTSAPSTPDIGPYSPANVTPITSWTLPNTSAYQLINSNDIQPYSMDSKSYRNSGTTSAHSTSDIGPYSPANITPITSWAPTNTSAYQLINSKPRQPYSIDARSYGNTGITSPPSTSYMGPYRPANITPYTSLNPPSNSVYQLIDSNNIEPYSTDTRSYRNTATTSPPSTSDIGPYSPANITPYPARTDLLRHTSISPPSIPASSMSNSGLPSVTSSTSFNSSCSAVNERFLSMPSTSHSPNQTTYQSTTAMPKSILRNGSSNRSSSTTYTRLNPPNILLSNVVNRELATVV